jgi:uncharacterized protein (DUF111 family)
MMLQSAPSHHITNCVASLAIKAVTTLALAEMHTHGANLIDQIHFQEVGTVDLMLIPWVLCWHCITLVLTWEVTTMLLP